ncbi:MAG: copper-binding protein [Phycisphaerales bacterium]|nr:copper-binding protein [Phycisphaerales bacterium]
MKLHYRTLIVASLVGVASVPAPGCKKKPETPAARSSMNALAHPSETYTVRGIIQTMPDPADPRAQLMIHHEHIPDFKGKSGKLHVYDDGVTGMKAMVMPFDTLGPNVVLEQFQVGDKVEFVLNVAREPSMSMAIVKMTKLPADTPISFDNKPNAEP